MHQTTAAKLHFQDYRETLGIETVYGVQMDHVFPRHTHRSLCIGLVEQGERIFVCRDQEYSVTPGQIFVIPPQAAHTCKSSATPHTYRLLMLLPDILASILPKAVTGGNVSCCFRRLTLDDQTLFENLLSVHRLLDSDKGLFFIQSALLSVVGAIVEQCVEATVSPEPAFGQQENISHIKKFMDVHYADDLSLADLACRAHLSPYHFLRVFTSLAGIPPHIYQQQVRIRQAKSRLLQGASILEAAIETSFGDQSHFSNVFKKMVGITPGEYIKCSREQR